MLKMSSFDADTHAVMFVPHINCVIDDAFLEIMPEVSRALLQFIDVMNLADPLLHFAPLFVVNQIQICAVGGPKVS